MEKNKQMSVFGVGPKLAVITLIYSVFIYFAGIYFKNTFEINFISRGVLTAAGIVLLVFGLTLHIICGRTIFKVRKQDILYTDGLYKMCRHPMYSVWIFFNIPGIALLAGSWLMFTIPLFMYIIFRVLIRTEEDYLKERYPQDYIKYRMYVNLVFPCLWKLIK